MSDGIEPLSTKSSRLVLSIVVALVLPLAGSTSACGHHEQSRSASTSTRMLAAVHESEARQALRIYIGDWLDEFDGADFESLISSAPSPSYHFTGHLLKLVPFGRAPIGHKLFRADFVFRPVIFTNSESPGAVWSSATYDLSWEQQTGSWTIALTSPSPANWRWSVW